GEKTRGIKTYGGTGRNGELPIAYVQGLIHRGEFERAYKAAMVLMENNLTADVALAQAKAGAPMHALAHLREIPEQSRNWVERSIAESPGIPKEKRDMLLKRAEAAARSV